MSRVPLNEIRVGFEIPVFEAPAIDRVRLAKYAGASGDFNPIHIDEPFARAAGFPSVIAHGMLSMGFVGECIERFAGVAAIVSLRARFKAVTFPGDTIRVSGVVTKVEHDADGRATITCDLKATRQDETVTVEASAVLRGR